MNTTEQIVESYFRICRNCLTVPDVKVPDGNGRQLDLFAYSVLDDVQYHIEVQVSHARQFAPSTSDILAKLDAKFLGKAKKREQKKHGGKEWYVREIQYVLPQSELEFSFACVSITTDEGGIHEGIGQRLCAA